MKYSRSYSEAQPKDSNASQVKLVVTSQEDDELGTTQDHLFASSQGINHGSSLKSRTKEMTAPIEMIVLLLLGIAGGVAHLVYYHSLDGRSVASQSISQEWAIRIGTGLAFLTKTVWTVAVLTAQSQQAWTTMDRKPLAATTVDAMILAPTNFTKFRHISLIKHAKTATLLAAIAWCIPLSAIFTPATLTVEPTSQPDPQHKSAKVPSIDMTNVTKFATMATCAADSCLSSIPPTAYGAMQFRYPNAQTVLVTTAALSSGQIQSMTPQFPNSTYTTRFFGPALRCDNANQSAALSIETLDKMTAPNISSSIGEISTNYYAFVPGRSKNQSLVAVDLSNLPQNYEDISSTTVPTAPEIWIRISNNDLASGSSATGQKNYVCTLQNTSYTTQFSFRNNLQETNTSVEYLGSMPYTTALASNDMETVIGAKPQLLTYQAIWVALSQLLVGRFFDNPLRTRLFQTPVIGSKEFAPYFDTNFGAATQPFKSNQTVAQIIETLSHNVTLSFFASALHL